MLVRIGLRYQRRKGEAESRLVSLPLAKEYKHVPCTDPSDGDLTGSK